MRARSRQHQFRLAHLVKQQPIWLDMKIAVADLIAFERVIAVSWFKRFVIEQKQDHGLQFDHILTAFLRPLDVLFERR
jgi:hypothetical protein